MRELKFTTESLFPKYIGSDRTFQHLWNIINEPATNNYPPYNIIKVDDERYLIEVALAGFDKDDLEIQLEHSILSITPKELIKKKSEAEYLHQGIAQRTFERKFTLAENVEVISAFMENGILSISLRHVTPEELKPKLIPIGSTAQLLTE
jgi:molecular chaperone IbpA